MNDSSRCIVFVETREICKYLCDYISGLGKKCGFVMSEISYIFMISIYRSIEVLNQTEVLSSIKVTAINRKLSRTLKMEKSQSVYSIVFLVAQYS